MQRHFAHELLRWRQRYSLTQDRAAQLLGVSPRMVRAWENRYRCPTTLGQEGLRARMAKVDASAATVTCPASISPDNRKGPACRQGQMTYDHDNTRTLPHPHKQKTESGRP